MTEGPEAVYALATRQATFKSSTGNKRRKVEGWPLPADHSVTPSSLALAGFYYAPLPDASDNATCFLCGKGLGGWEDGDQALEEHISHTIKDGVKKGCPFALLGGGSEWLHKLRLDEGKDLIKMRKDTFGKKSKFWVHAGKRSWPTPDKMANAGFFLNCLEDQGDAVQCCWCGVSLDGWEKGDDPLLEHYKRRPQCHFFSKNSALATHAKTATAQPRASASADPPTDDDWEQLIPEAKSKPKPSGKRKAKDPVLHDTSAVFNESQLSVASAGPLTRSTRSGMISSLASQSQPAVPSRKTSTRPPALASATGSDGAALDHTESQDGRSGTEIVQRGKPPSHKLPAKGKGKAAGALPREADSDVEIIDDENVSLKGAAAPPSAPHIIDQVSDKQTGKTPVPLPPERPASPEPELELRFEPPAANLSTVPEADDEETGPAEDEEMPPPTLPTPKDTSKPSRPQAQTISSHKGHVSQTEHIAAAPMLHPVAATSTSTSATPMPATASDASLPPAQYNDLLEGVNDVQLSMGVKEWFKYLMDIELERAEREMQGKLDAFDQNVERGWERLKSIGIAQ